MPIARSQLDETVRNVLLRRWDPIVVRDNPHAASEFDAYVPTIAEMLLADVDRYALGKSFVRRECPALQWCHFRYASSDGWGVKYVSDYNAPEIVTYLLAFTVGVVGFFVVLKRRNLVVGTLGVVLSLMGILSFAIEGSHWFVDHNRSWLAFSPAAMFALAFLACLPKRIADDERAKPIRDFA